MPSPLDLAALLQPGSFDTTGVEGSAPMVPMPAPPLAHAPDLQTTASPMRSAGPTPQQGHGFKLDELLRQIAPAIGAMTMHGSQQTGFLRGYEREQMRMAEEKQQRTQQDQARQAKAEQFRMDIYQQAQTITDPAEWAQFVDFATDMALRAGFISDPAEMKSFLKYPAHLEKGRRQKDLLDKLGELDKKGYDVEQLMEMNPTLTLSDGTRIKYKDAVTIAGAFPDTEHGAMLPPKKPGEQPTLERVEGAVNGKHIFANRNPKTGKYMDPDTGNVLLGFVPYDDPTKATHGQLENDLLRAQIRNEKKKGDPATPPPASPYSQERASRTLASVRELSAKVNRWTTGIGSVLARVPESDARNFAAELDTLKANIAFSELTAMREASKTGGALGAVSEREMQLLQSALGALDAGQSPQNIKKQLKKIEDSITRWQQAQGVASPMPTDASSRIGKPVTVRGKKMVITKVYPDGSFDAEPSR